MVLTIRTTVSTVVAFRRFKRVERECASIQRGESRDSVTAKLGKPRWARCGGGPHRNDCNEEYGYSHPFAPVVPRYFIVSFSDYHKVTDAKCFPLREELNSARFEVIHRACNLDAAGGFKIP